MKNAFAALILAGVALISAAPAYATVAMHHHGDDDDDPGYQIDGGGTPGVEHYPSVCEVQPLACALHYNPGPGTWTRPDPEPYH